MSESQVPYQVTADDKSKVMTVLPLLDNGEGFGIDKLRQIFPKEGWNVIHAIADALVTEGKLTKSLQPLRGGKTKIWVYRKV